MKIERMTSARQRGRGVSGSGWHSMETSVARQTGGGRSRMPRESTTERIAWHRSELLRLEREQRQQLVATIAAVVGSRAFTNRELWDHRLVSPALAALFDDAGLTNARQLGKRLKQ